MDWGKVIVKALVGLGLGIAAVLLSAAAGYLMDAQNISTLLLSAAAVYSLAGFRIANGL